MRNSLNRFFHACMAFALLMSCEYAMATDLLGLYQSAMSDNPTLKARRFGVDRARADADQAAISQGGPVHHSTVANGHVGTDPHRLAGIAMQHSPVLHVAALAHHDRAHIPAGHGRGPEAGAGRQLHIADHHR